VEGTDDVLRELDADFELALRRAILAAAADRSSCEIAARCTSDGSSSISVVPEGVTTTIYEKKGSERDINGSWQITHLDA
jgi:hypothetical protein